MLEIASTTVLVADLMSDAGTFLLYAVGAVLGGWIALVGVRFAITKIGKYITGRKF